MPAPTVPRLLVSARSTADAQAAIAGGCDILDLKEPARGSLGRPDPETIAAICHLTDAAIPTTAISVALGEVAEWHGDRGTTDSALPSNVAYAKLGLSRCRRDRNWPRRWQNVRNQIETATGRSLGWIAVIYADAGADAPAAEDVVDVAASTRCRGVLVDTFCKDGRQLLDHVSPETLAQWRTASHASGMLFAVAGSLRASDLPRLITVQPDVVAVRGAVCRDGLRDGDVCPEAVQRLRAAIHNAPC